MILNHRVYFLHQDYEYSSAIDMYTWCINYFGATDQGWQCERSNTKLVFKFSDYDDMMQFKLAFGGTYSNLFIYTNRPRRDDV